MKNSINLSIFSAPGSGVRKNLFTVLSFFITTVLMISCRKEVGEKMDPSLSADSTVTGQSALSALATGNAYYISPSGSDNNTGTKNSPWFTLTKAWTSIQAGDTLYLRGGTYAYTKAPYLDGKNGTASNKIHVFGYPGERPIVTRASNYTWEPQFHRSGVYFEGNYFHWKNIRFTGFFQPSGNGNVHSAFMAYHSSNNLFEWMEFDNSGAGFSMEGSSNNNLLLNLDGHDNKDPYSGYGNSDGIQLTYCASGTVNTVRNCRAWNNGDDGFDVFENQGFVTFENCWSYHNGFIPGTNNQGGNGNGFKFGYSANDNQIRRTLRNCIAVGNRLTGFDIQEATCRLQIDNSIAYNNGNGTGQAFGFHTNYQTRAHIIRNCVAFNNDEEEANLNSQTISTTCSNNDGSEGWTNNASSADFQSVDVAQIILPRKADGSLPDITFLRLATGSDLINTGTNIGLPFSGSAPDRGAFESGGTTTPPPTNQPPVANAGSDKAITLPVSSVTFTGSGTDPDGTIASYAWSFRSGPNTPALSGVSTTALSASNLVTGTYVLRLTVTDNAGATGYDEVNVVVSAVTPPPTGNQAPVANAGADKTVTLPLNSVSLAGSGTDPDGTIVSYAWTRKSGPNTPALSGTSTATLSASNLVVGSYVFRLTVTDNRGLTAYDQVKVTVNAGTTPPPPPTPTSLINVSQAVHDAGFAYYVPQNFGTLPDDNSNNTRSVLRIFENGVELKPAHSTHSSIANLGGGRFSHWGDGSFIALYFSASDNSNPKTNGRTYTYSITP